LDKETASRIASWTSAGEDDLPTKPSEREKRVPSSLLSVSESASDTGPDELLAHLRHLYADLGAVIARDPEQEILGIALTTVDRVMTASRRYFESARASSLLAGSIPELISPATVSVAEPIRALDAWLVVGQVLAALGDPAPAPPFGALGHTRWSSGEPC
jgi:hypothetical protein